MHKRKFGWGGGRKRGQCPPIFFLHNNIFLLATALRGGGQMKSICVTVGETGVCILSTGSNQGCGVGVGRNFKGSRSR
jgi:hypothetical protein